MSRLRRRARGPRDFMHRSKRPPTTSQLGHLPPDLGHRRVPHVGFGSESGSKIKSLDGRHQSILDVQARSRLVRPTYAAPYV